MLRDKDLIFLQPIAIYPVQMSSLFQYVETYSSFVEKQTNSRK